MPFQYKQTITCIDYCKCTIIRKRKRSTPVLFHPHALGGFTKRPTVSTEMAPPTEVQRAPQYTCTKQKIFIILLYITIIISSWKCLFKGDVAIPTLT